MVPFLDSIIWEFAVFSAQSMHQPDTPVSHDAGDPRQFSSGQPARTWVSVFTLAILTAGAAALRFLFLARKPFWFDECFSVEVARLSWHDFVRLLWWREANMSLYYVLLREWLYFGLNPFFIRSFSVLCSLATLPAIFWLGCRRPIGAEREANSSRRDRHHRPRRVLCFGRARAAN